MNLRWDQIVNCAWHKPMAIVEVRTGLPVPAERIERAPDSPEKRMINDTHGICFECAKKKFPNLDHKLLFETIVGDQAQP